MFPIASPYQHSLTKPQLEKSLEAAETASASTARSTRAVDRQIADLKSQIERREKQSTALSDDLSKARDKIQNLLSTIEELQGSDSTAQLSAKRAERELRDERESRLRLERELEGWKGLRMERGSVRGSVRGGFAGQFGVGSDAGDSMSRRGSSIGLEGLPHRQLRKISGQSFL